jgi:hypothetical protein
MKNKYDICGEKTTIYLSSQKYGPMETYINTEDFTKADEFSGTWYASWNKTSKSFYVLGNMTTKDGNRRPVKLHRFIMQVDDPLEIIDHINHNTLDNTRSNLNIVTQAENSQNFRLYKCNKSGCSGVIWNKEKSKWYSYIRIDKVQRSLGYYSDLDEAISVRKNAEETYYTYKQSISKETN